MPCGLGYRDSYAAWLLHPNHENAIEFLKITALKYLSYRPRTNPIGRANSRTNKINVAF
jgi:hypothetical protein